MSKFINYCKESYNELVHKTTWPTTKELTSQALLVLYAAVAIAVVVGVMDVTFQSVMEFVYP